MTRIRKSARNLAEPGPKALKALHRALEAHYADLVSAPLPERLTELLARLETEDRVPDPKSGDDDPNP
ncbi:MAG TPA: NepR family anti-sigma factor [Roseiarcus sp.]|nr:NepR family anti-sigma factor [Roseiarcus sp.]